ncbi:MAG: serine/threonine protein kinase, partial [Myxococcota bacterium]|nr:serine/threonine protein kinase [Myxococcota bacterium]
MSVTTPTMQATERRNEAQQQEVVARLSSDGASEVYLVRLFDGWKDTLVVLKCLPVALATDPEYLERFRSEARIAALLDHPRIARVLEVVESREDFYTLEYVQGADLRRLLAVLAKQGRTLPLACAVSIGIELCHALDHAHHLCNARGTALDIIHRELAPSKVLLGVNGEVKLTGFGVGDMITRRLARDTPPQARTERLGYLSPEQCLGKPLDARSDVFALGVMLYEITTGTRLFAASTDRQIMDRIIRCTVPRPSEIRRGYPKELETVLMRALERDPEARYRSAGDMQRDLETFLWAKWPTASPDALAGVVSAAFPPAGTVAPGLATGSMELERIDPTQLPGPVPFA